MPSLQQLLVIHYLDGLYRLHCERCSVRTVANTYAAAREISASHSCAASSPWQSLSERVIAATDRILEQENRK